MNVDDMYPPSDMNFVGGGDFKAVGHQLCRMVKDGCGLNPNDRVLDVGCGIGRMAIPLTQIIGPQGKYDGFDIVDVGINWCKEKVTPHYPNFRFHLADVFNLGYHPQGRHKAENYVFPFPDQSYDLVVLTSVFTHMLGTPMENYLSQISRVLAVGGRAFITYYLRTEVAAARIREGKSYFNFTNFRDGCWVHNPACPEDAVCFDIEKIEALYEKYGFVIEKTKCGGWSDGSEPGAQDVVVARKVRHVDVKPKANGGWGKFVGWIRDTVPGIRASGKGVISDGMKQLRAR